MNALLTTIVLWLSLNFDLPANYEPPTVAFVNIADITSKQYAGAFAPEATMSSGKNDRTVVAFYDSPKRTIFLAEGWTGNTPAESSVLVHEMVHHLQNLAGQTYNCPEEREQLAYQAQEKWLSQMGRSIHTEFQIDPFTLLVMTHCLN
jgi:predicted metalloprotease